MIYKKVRFKKTLSLYAFVCSLSLISTNVFSQNKVAPSTPPVSTPSSVIAPSAITAAEATTASAPEVNALQEAGKFRIGSDPTIWIMIFLFNLSLAVVIERSWVLYRNRGDNATLVSLLTTEISRDGDIAKLAETVIDKKFGVEGRVAAVTLKGWQYGEKTMKEYSEAAMLAERRNLEKRLVILSTLGNNTPFIGLLGTVLGIMKAFRDLAVMGEAGPAVVMRGISEALVATAMGLAVAIPVVISYNALSKKVKDKMSQSEEIATLLRAIKLSVSTK